MWHGLKWPRKEFNALIENSSLPEAQRNINIYCLIAIYIVKEEIYNFVCVRSALKSLRERFIGFHTLTIINRLVIPGNCKVFAIRNLL